MQKTINGAMLRSMFLTAAKLLEVNRVQVDALNVFPVPDGDTGTNMSLTFQSAIKELSNCRSNKIEDITEAVSKGALRGARGNSGVILSQVIRGFHTDGRYNVYSTLAYVEVPAFGYKVLKIFKEKQALHLYM